MAHPAAFPVDELLADCSIDRTRRSGPGGQHRNKVETAVVITHKPTGIRSEASERRSQAENLAQAIFRLRLQLALHVRTKPSDVPSELWGSRARGGRISVNDSHEDFPPLLAEALDTLSAYKCSPAEAGQALGVTSSQLVKLVKQEPKAFQLLNAMRQKSGQSPLK